MPKRSNLYNMENPNNTRLPFVPKSVTGLPAPPPMPGPYPQGPSVYPKLLPTPPPMPGQYPSMPSPYRKEKVDGGRHFRKRRHTKKSKHPKRKTRKSSRRHH